MYHIIVTDNQFVFVNRGMCSDMTKDMDHIIHYCLLNSTSHDNATIVSIFTVVIAYKICNLKLAD